MSKPKGAYFSPACRRMLCTSGFAKSPLCFGIVTLPGCTGCVYLMMTAYCFFEYPTVLQYHFFKFPKCHERSLLTLIILTRIARAVNKWTLQKIYISREKSGRDNDCPTRFSYCLRRPASGQLIGWQQLFLCRRPVVLDFLLHVRG